MNRTIEYMIKKEEDGLRIEQFLKRRGYSSKNLTAIKRMPKSVLVNGEHFYMRQELHEGDLLAIHEDLALFRDIDTGKDFDQGGFAGAVLADQSMDLTGTDAQRHALQGHDTGEAFNDIS